MKSNTIFSALLIILFSKVSCNSNINKLKKEAESGDAEAQYNLAVEYLIGEETKADDDLAFKWMEKSAQHGHIVAQRDLGHHYFD